MDEIANKCAIFIFGLVLSVAVSAAKPGTETPGQATGYLGYTEETFTGSDGMHVMYGACQLNFGEGALVCSTKQLFESPNIADVEITNQIGMWVRPFMISQGANVYDYSGKWLSSGSLVCDGGLDTGMGVDTNFVVQQFSCSSVAIPAACCR